MNSLLIEYDVFNDDNFILPKSMHLRMIRFVDNPNANGEDGKGLGMSSSSSPLEKALTSTRQCHLQSMVSN